MRSMIVWMLAVIAVGVGAHHQALRGADAGDDFLKKIQGTWKFVSHVFGDKAQSKEELANQTITFADNKWTVRQDGKVVSGGTHRFDPSKTPGQVDAVVTEGEDKGNTMLGIYELKGDTIRVCFDPKGKKRPSDFSIKEGRMTAVVERQKK